MVHRSVCVLLLLLQLLTCRTGLSASGNKLDSSYGPSSVEINGVGIITVGIPYGFTCSAACYPPCQYSWTRGNVTTQGPELSLQFMHIEPTQVLTCNVTNPASGKSVTVHKTLQMTAGPSNVQITGPPMLTIGVASVYTCTADCYPACTYSWTVVLQDETYSTSQGSTISVIPPASTVASETLICEAQDTISHLYISTTLFLWVARLSDISIAGDTTVTMGQKYTFTCLVLCTPSCTFTWKYGGKSFPGNQVEIPIYHQGAEKKFASHMDIMFSDYTKIEPLTCEATNTASHARISATTNLTVIDPISVQPASEGAADSGKSFSLKCVGSQNPASVTWLKNSSPMPESPRIQYSANNITMTFSPLLQTDAGLYQCVVTETDCTIQSIGYKMQVNYGPSSAVINGVDIVTVGVQYSFNCSASCFPACQITWVRGNVTTKGSELSVQFKELQPTQILTCRALNPTTGASVTVQKTLEMTAGPSNIQISGPPYLTPGVTSNYVCSANCYPSCSYNWTVVTEGVMLSTAEGNTVSVSPLASVTSETLLCRALDAVSDLHISTSLQLWVASVSEVIIAGDSAVEMGKQYTYTCFATCVPSCSFTWKYGGKTFEGAHIQVPILRALDNGKFSSQLQVTVSDSSKIELLTCEATNTISNASMSATKNLTVIDPFSVRPTSQALPVAGQSFSLSCTGAQQPASITWFKNKSPMPEYDHVQLSPDNTTVSFSPLMQMDGGFYQCLVLEHGNRTINYDSLVVAVGGTPIMSVGYQVVVNYGPNEVLIVKPNKGPVGQEMFMKAGSTAELQCQTDCFPVCTIAWFYRGNLLGTNTSIVFTPVTPPYEASLTCVAFNPASMQNRTAETTVVVPDGPKSVIISGPKSLEIGVTSTFTCTAECTPSCTFTWTLYGKSITGGVISITVNRQTSSESISCQAENTYTGTTAMVNETLSVSDPHWCGC